MVTCARCEITKAGERKNKGGHYRVDLGRSFPFVLPQGESIFRPLLTTHDGTGGEVRWQLALQLGGGVTGEASGLDDDAVPLACHEIRSRAPGGTPGAN